MSVSKALFLAALIALIVAAALCFIGTGVTQLHILGVLAAGLACIAAEPLAT